MSHTNVQLPNAKAIASVILRGKVFPLVRYDSKVCLTLQGIAHYMRLSIDTMAVIEQGQHAFEVASLNIVESSPLAALGFPSERVTAAKVMPLDRVGLLLAVLALVPTYEHDALSLARVVKNLIAELAKVEKPTPAAPSAPAQPGVDMAGGVDKTVLTVTVEIEGGQDLPSNQVIGDALTTALVSVLGGAMVSATAATVPSPTRH
ncbi:hypothetical protein ACQKIE_18615 [Luteibacter sp. NPDC031894]|uniref:hypothetical protein n=1 Tax=Luteibacter sp. NPDC031894 TaxID=3390572 RepID=UPI003CFF18CD